MATINNDLSNLKLSSIYTDDGVVRRYNRKRDKGVIPSAWRDEKVLGQGGFGSVILQKDGSGHLRAVKVLFERSNVDYKRELTALFMLSDRKDLFVEFLGWFQDSTGNSVSIIMEFIEHGDLGHLMNSGLAKSHAREITTQVLEGLDVLHGRNLCHRDIKPQNILVASVHPIWVKIADFGASKHFGDSMLRTQIGTSGYLAPEILGIGGNYSTAVDLWSLGCIIFEMLASHNPFASTTTQITDCSGLAPNAGPQFDPYLLSCFCYGKIPLPLDSLQGSDGRAIALIKGLLHPDPSKRLTAKLALQTTWILGTEGPVRLLLSSTLAGNAKTVGLLLQSGIRPEWTSQLGKNVLLEGARLGNTGIVGLLLDHGAKLDTKDQAGMTALLHAASIGATDMVELLLDRGAWLNGKDNAGMTALLHAASKGASDTVALLLDRGAQLNEKDSIGMTALLHAASVGAVDVVEVLLNRGVDTSVRGEDGMTAVLYAVLGRNVETVKILLDNGAGIDDRDDFGRTALLEAAGEGHTAIVELLLDRGADGDIRGEDEMTALHYAAWTGKVPTVLFLLDRGADTEATNNLGRTALLEAAGDGNVEMVGLLLNCGADLEGKGNSGMTSLHYAAYCGQTETVGLLLDRGADIMAEGGIGMTALHYASWMGKTETVRYLLGRGGDTRARDHHGRTALQIAKLNGYTDTSHLLERHIQLSSENA